MDVVCNIKIELEREEISRRVLYPTTMYSKSKNVDHLNKYW